MPDRDRMLPYLLQRLSIARMGTPGDTDRRLYLSIDIVESHSERRSVFFQIEQRKVSDTLGCFRVEAVRIVAEMCIRDSFLSLSNLCHDVFGEQWLSHRQRKTVLLLLWPWLVVLFFNQ